jgi:hypothetical protein
VTGIVTCHCLYYLNFRLIVLQIAVILALVGVSIAAPQYPAGFLGAHPYAAHAGPLAYAHHHAPLAYAAPAPVVRGRT